MKYFCQFCFLVIAIFTISILSVSAESVKPSHIRKLEPGQEIANLNKLQFESEYTLQRLTERTYVVMVTCPRQQHRCLS